MPTTKPVRWLARSRDDLRGFPAEVRREIGYALYFAQMGDKHPSAKPLRGFGGAGVLEIVEDYDGSTYRAVYTVKFSAAVYVLHAFQKKSKKGVRTPKQEIDLVKNRLRLAEEDYVEWQRKNRGAR
jgi:phage-related protein